MQPDHPTSRKPKLGQSYFSKPPCTEASWSHSPCRAQQRKGAPKRVIGTRWCLCSQNFCSASPPWEPKRPQLTPNCGHSKHTPAMQQSFATAPPACANHLAARTALSSDPRVKQGSENSSIPQSKKKLNLRGKVWPGLFGFTGACTKEAVTKSPAEFGSSAHNGFKASRALQTPHAFKLGEKLLFLQHWLTNGTAALWIQYS